MKKLFILFTIFTVMLLDVVSLKAADVKKIDLNLRRNEISFSFLEVPSGEVTLIQTGTGKNILINTGGTNSRNQLLERLEMYGVDKIDILIMTDNDNETTANLSWLKENYEIDKIVLPYPIKNEYEEQYNLDHLKVSSWKAGDHHEIVPGLFVKVLYADYSTTNSGMVLAFFYGSQQLLYMGVANEEIETNLVNSYPTIKAKILKVGEFGDKGTSQYFLEKVDPQIAVIFHKGKNGPSQGVLERLNETWIDIYQTRQFGNITIKCDQEKYEVITIEDDSK